jgi:hypothetical protein
MMCAAGVFVGPLDRQPVRANLVRVRSQRFDRDKEGKMKLLTSVLSAVMILAAVTGCYSRKERIIERERPVSSGSTTTIVTPDSTVKVK